MSSTLVRTTGSYKLYDITIDAFDPQGNKMPVRVHFFENKKPGKLPMLLMIPPIHGVTAREKKVSEHFISCGYHSVVLEPVKDITDSSLTLNNFNNSLLSFVSAVRSTIDVFEAKEQVDPKNLFVWAASMGACYGSIAVSLDKRINAAIFIVGGTPIANIVTESQQENVAKYRRERMQEEHLDSIEAFRNKLRENIAIEVAQFAKQRSSSDLMFVIALKDHSVPTQYQFQLAKAFGDNATVIQNNAGHAATILKMHLSNLDQFSDFTNSKLKH
ncbi:MAG: hypothetical protein K0Q95_1443 [Bacteroidota bacterium]|nr:hypothetical protein [Bacteroidota bacterium]